jgi:hypothetical protein
MSVGFGKYPSFSTTVHSGAVKLGVPSQSNSLVWGKISALETVKSVSLISHEVLSNSILSSLISRWITPASSWR